jgi:hypothetical protein
LQLKRHFTGLESLRSGPNNDYDVPARQRDFLLVKPEPLPQAALHAVPAHGIEEAFLDDQAQPVVPGLVGRHIDAEMPGAKSSGGSLDSLIFISGVEPLLGAEPTVSPHGATLRRALLRGLVCHLDAQTLASLGPPAPDDITAGSGGHALEESMGSLSLDVAGLKGSFAHCRFPCFSL